MNLPFNPKELPRELAPFYIPATSKDMESMLKEIGLNGLEELYSHIPLSLRFSQAPAVGPSLAYDDLIKHMEALSQKNHLRTSFIGDGLKQYKTPEIVSLVAPNRGLLTAYTPYQPERSQGTLHSLWIYSSALSMLTGFEAVNASLYDRATALYEALQCAKRLAKGRKRYKALLLESLFPGDVEVVLTHARGTDLDIHLVPVDPKTGRTDVEQAKKILLSGNDENVPWVALAFPQVNSFGILEDVDALTDLGKEQGLTTIAVIDPMLLATDGLKPPSKFGKNAEGTHIFVGEGQHLAIPAYFGGPGLGIFGVRYQDKNPAAMAVLRATPGRFVGKAFDSKGNECRTLVLSTREQHIRRDKATSNICSNQSFVATLAGAAILGRGERGMTQACTTGRQSAHRMARELTRLPGVKLAFPQSPFYNEFVLKITGTDIDKLIGRARDFDLHLGVNVSSRLKGQDLLLLSFTDIQEEKDLEKLFAFFDKEFGKGKGKPLEKGQEPLAPSQNYLRQGPVDLPNLPLSDLKDFYEKLGEQNISPDDHIYPLGSCTMKYNPYVHEYVVGRPGWQGVHPEAPLEDVQGCLEILYGIQEMFKTLTGLPGVTTQPMAGAQGELVGLKMFQAYHADQGEEEQRKIVLIPETAHGTNPASATYAGLTTKEENGQHFGIVEIRANALGMMDFGHLKELVELHGRRILGVMVTNPNTSGIFETQFKEMADLIHGVGGLVYMDGANMNAIAGWVNLERMGVDAVHNNLHKTWTIPHGGGGPGDAIVAVSSKLLSYLPGMQVIKDPGSGRFELERPARSIGTVQRHFGNFAHKIRCYAYLKTLGTEGVRKMAAMATLSARYLYQKLLAIFPTLPEGSQHEPRMHEFIITLTANTFQKIERVGIPKAQAITKIGKLFLDFGIHTPTVAFPEAFGLMIEPTESYTKDELDRFVDVIKAIHLLVNETPEVLQSAPHFTPISKVDEVAANKALVFQEKIVSLPKVLPNRLLPAKLAQMTVGEICKEILLAHKKA